MNGYLIVRAVFVILVVYTAVAISPIEGHPAINAALGGAVAFIIVITEARLRDAAVTSLFGGLIGLGVGLAIASVIGRALFWVDLDADLCAPEGPGAAALRDLRAVTVWVRVMGCYPRGLEPV